MSKPTGDNEAAEASEMNKNPIQDQQEGSMNNGETGRDIKPGENPVKKIKTDDDAYRVKKPS